MGFRTRAIRVRPSPPLLRMDARHRPCRPTQTVMAFRTRMTVVLLNLPRRSAAAPNTWCSRRREPWSAASASRTSACPMPSSRPAASVQRRRQRLAVWAALDPLGARSRLRPGKGRRQRLQPLVRRRHIHPAPRCARRFGGCATATATAGTHALYTREAALPPPSRAPALHGQAEGHLCAVDGRWAPGWPWARSSSS